MDAAVPSTPEVSESPLAAERLRLMRQAITNNLAAPIGAVVGIVLVPVMLRALGPDAYSLWIVAMSLAGIVAASDLGLSWGICRVVAADPEGRDAGHAMFVRSAANIYAGIGLLAGLIVVLAGLVSGNRLHLPADVERAAPQVFGLVGASFFLERLGAFGSAVLAGLRRFGSINLVAGSVSVLWGAGVIFVLVNGGSVQAVAGCLLATALARCGATLFLVARLAPGYRYRPGLVDWRAVRNHASFALSSFLVDGLGRLAWNCGPVLLGYIRGPAAAVPFYVAQKIPVAVSSMSWRAAEVLFPAASQGLNDRLRTRDTLRVGSRWVLVLALPFAVMLFAAAPAILKAWLGSPPPESVAILRLLAVLVLADAVMVGPLHVLWGRGSVKPVLGTYAGFGLGVVVLTVMLTFPLGAAGAALGLLAPAGAAAAVLFMAASRACAISARELLAESWRGLVLPAGVCAASAALLVQIGGHDRSWLCAALAASALAYGIALFGASGNADEKRFLRDVPAWLTRIGSRATRGARRAAAKVKPVRSMWHGVLALIDLLRDQSRDPAHFERLYRVPDPWRYETGGDRQRHLLAASMLERARPDGFRRALEIGCGEGIFTAMLARQCREVVALDFAPTALRRAKQRLPDPHVRFERFDLRLDPIPGESDLITVMDVLSGFTRPASLKRATDKLIAGLAPGGYLLLTDPRQSPLFETAWWGKRLLRGGLNIRTFVGSQAALNIVSTEETETHVLGLFRKVPA